MTTLAAAYDERYLGPYRETLSTYEVARWTALSHFVSAAGLVAPDLRVLDYGCGQGMHFPLWRAMFPNCDLHGTDLSTVAIAKARERFPDLSNRLTTIGESHTPNAETFDLVLSVEVMEHVEDLDAYLIDVARRLRPGGHFLWTTPCANAFSIEHLYAAATRQIDPTEYASRRWRWEDPLHLRRLTSREAAHALRTHGFEQLRFRYRAHLFSFVCDRLLQSRFPKSSESLMKLDYALFRMLPNGASMIGLARRAQT